MEENKQIVIFDLETTGLDKSSDQIIQFSAVKIKYSGKKFNIIDKIDLKICPDGEFKINLLAYIKHGIDAQSLLDKPHFKDVADQIIEFIGDSDILTYNGTSFDIPFLVNSLNKVGKTINFLNRKCYDVYAEERRRHGMNLESVFERYTGKTMEEAGYKAHDALGDSLATFEVFSRQMEEKEFGPENMICEDNVIVNSMFNGKEQPCFNIGKYKGYPLAYVNYEPEGKGYLWWCLYKSNFSETAKNLIRRYYTT